MVADSLHIAAGAALALAGWFVPRWVAGAGIFRWPAVLLDFAPVLLAAALLLTASGRPIFAGLIVFSLGAGFALADHAKRETLREPVVFSDISELPHVFTHPQLYLPFAGPGLVIGSAIAAVAACLALLFFEPGLWRPSPAAVLATVVLPWAVAEMMSREPALGAVAATLRRLDPVGEPLADAASFGPFAMLLVYGTIARAERIVRRARHMPAPAPSLRRSPAAAAVPLVLVQCELFFDARRMSPLIPGDLLPGLDACHRECATFGRFDVSGWGANTMRAEFAALTGIPEADLGYDRFNPYHAFARSPIASLAWHLRGQGYRTLCLHPFDRGFFRRDVTLPALGFETFLGLESLGGSRRPPYYSDPDLARRIVSEFGAGGPPLFVFAITMGNHGPWQSAGPAIDADLVRRFKSADLPQGGELLRYLDGLRRSDEMLQILMEGMERFCPDGILGFYGDHLPSLPRAFDHFGFDEMSSDYVLWQSAARPARRLDLPAHRLPRMIIEALRDCGAIDRRDRAEPVFVAGVAD